MAKIQGKKLQLGMAGEYSVCAELLKRGHNASITMGNAKAVDIIIFTSDNTYRRIEVKTSRNKRFVTGFFQKYYDKTLALHPDFWVLVHLDEEFKSRYFILTHEEMGSVQMKRNEMDDWERIVGCDNVLLKDIEQFEDKWEKICETKESAETGHLHNRVD